MNLSAAAGILSIVALVAVSLVCSFITLFGLHFYGREIILSIGSNDKSLLFWYLPLLLFGIIALKIALWAGKAAYRRIKARSH